MNFKKNMNRFVLCFSVLILPNFLFAQTQTTIINDVYDSSQIISSPQKPTNRPSVALVLSGGGARGFAHLPVLELLKEYDIPVDIVLGTSVGSIVGGMYSAGYSVEEMKKIFFSLSWSNVFEDKTYEASEKRNARQSDVSTPFSVKFLKDSNGSSVSLGSGILTGQYAYELMKKLLLAVPSDIDFNDLPIPFRAVGVNLLTGKVEVFQKGDIAEAIRASMSIPAFFQAMKIDGKYYIDGGTRDNTPIDIAVKMGYDIIIVSEISSPLYKNFDTYFSNPANILMQMTNMEQAIRNQNVYQKASLVMFPNFGNCTILDFAKSHEIYDASFNSVDIYRDDLQKIKDQITNSSVAKDTVKEKKLKNQYSQNKFPIISTVIVSGGNEQDELLVKKSFQRIKNEELTKELYETFEKEIYKSGKYSSVLTRITQNSNDKSTMEVVLEKKEKESSAFLFGIDYQGTLTNQAMNDVTFNVELQKRNFFGDGSLLSMQLSALTDYIFAIKYVQPLSSFMYAELEFASSNNRSIVSSGFDYYPMQAKQLLSHEVTFTLGFPISNWITFFTGMHFGVYNSEDFISGGGKTKATDFFLDFNFDTFNSACLPSSGVQFLTSGKGIIPIDDVEEVPIYDVEKVEFKSIIPLSKKIGFLLKGLYGSNYSEDMKQRPELISIYGFRLSDRSFFPHVADLSSYGLYKIAIGGSFQFSPWDQLSILGGRAFFAVSAAVGNCWLDRNDMSFDSPVWRSSFDIGIRFSDSLGLLLRGGMGKSGNEIQPFFALDIGKVNF